MEILLDDRIVRRLLESQLKIERLKLDEVRILRSRIAGIDITVTIQLCILKATIEELERQIKILKP